MTEKIRKTWTGTLDAVHDLPESQLHHVRLELRHDAGKEAEDAMTKALSPVIGKARVIHYAGVRRGISWDKPRWQVLGSTTRRSVRLRAKHLKASQTKALVDALADIPGARDLRLQGRS